jgi:hypothetical protein
MITASLITSTIDWKTESDGMVMEDEDEMALGLYDSMDGPSEEELYLSGTSFA